MSSMAGITYNEYSLHSDRIIIPTSTTVTGPYQITSLYRIQSIFVHCLKHLRLQRMHYSVKSKPINKSQLMHTWICKYNFQMNSESYFFYKGPSFLLCPLSIFQIYQIAFILSPTEGYHGCFQVMAIINKFAINIHVQSFVCNIFFQLLWVNTKAYVYWMIWYKQVQFRRNCLPRLLFSYV